MRKKCSLSASLSILVMPLLLIFSCLMAQPAAASAPSIEWQKCLGGSDVDAAVSIQITSDGGCIIAGSTASNDGDVSRNNDTGKLADAWIVKLNPKGSIEWQKCFDPSGSYTVSSIWQTNDGGYITAGSTRSKNIERHHGKVDAWIMKLNPKGNIEWEKCFGGSSDDHASPIQQTDDGGYIFAGLTISNDGDVSGHHGIGIPDAWVVKLDSSGTIDWQKCYGGSGIEWVRSIQQTSDGGYIFAGLTYSNDGDVTGFHSSSKKIGDPDVWVMKINSTGNIEWQKCLGGSENDEANSIRQTSDGGFIVAGKTRSDDGDVSGNHGQDAWVVKLNPKGNIEWQKCLGGSWRDEAYSIQQTNDGGFIIAGETMSDDGDVSGNHGDVDAWVVKLNPKGDIEWQKCLGGSENDVARSIHQMSDGGYIVAGSTSSNDGDVSGNHGKSDAWIVKLAP